MSIYGYNKLDPQYSTIFMPLAYQTDVSGTFQTPTLSRQPDAPAYVTVGDGSTEATFPEQLQRRGNLFDGANYLDLNWASGGVLDTQTFTVCTLVKPQRPAADGRIFEIGIVGQRYSLYYDLSADEIVWWKDDTVDQSLTSGFGTSYGQMFAVCASVSSSAMKLWVNGRLMDFLLGDYRLASFDGSSEAYFGQDVAGGNRFKGRLYTAAIYPFELTATQVREWERRIRQLRTSHDLFTPAYLISGATGVWSEWSTDSEVTYNTQPSVSDWTTGTGWSGSGATGPYAHSAGSVGDLTQALGVVGNRVQVTYTINGRTAGTLTFKAGTTVGTARSTNATFTEDLTVAGNTTLTFAADASFDGTVTITSVVNLSLTQAGFRASTGALAGSALVQATAASMPWWDSGLRFDGTEDFLESNASVTDWSFLHDPAGCTVAFDITPPNQQGYVFDTLNFSGANKGLGITYFGAAQKFQLQLGNGTGTFIQQNADLTSVAAPPNLRYVCILRLPTAGTVDFRMNGVSQATSLSCAGRVAGNAAFTLHLGKRPGGVLLGQRMRAFFAVDRVLTDTECERLEAYWS